MKSFTRLKDFLEDGREDVPIHFEYGASLRIWGINVPFEDIEKALTIHASSKHRKGEVHGKSMYAEDGWMLDSPLSEQSPLSEHLEWLWARLEPHKAYLLKLKERFSVDIFAGYRSNCDMAGVKIPIESMKIYFELGIPFGLSITVG